MAKEGFDVLDIESSHFRPKLAFFSRELANVLLHIERRFRRARKLHLNVTEEGTMQNTGHEMNGSQSGLVIPILLATNGDGLFVGALSQEVILVGALDRVVEPFNQESRPTDDVLIGRQISRIIGIF